MLRGKTKPCFSFHSTFIHILFETKRREKKVMKKTKEKTWMLIIETKSYRGLSCYRKVLFVSAPDHQVAKEKARDWCDGEQITSISILPFDPNRMGDSLIDSTGLTVLKRARSRNIRTSIHAGSPNTRPRRPSTINTAIFV